VTVQQIGSAMLRKGEQAVLAELKAATTPAGMGWIEGLPDPTLAIGLFERADDWCATAFVYCAEPQPVPRVDVALATADVTGIPDGHRVVRRPQP
jgi:hypothetical protein